MSLRLGAITVGSGKVRVVWDVIGDSGHEYDCAGVLLGQGDHTWSQPPTAAQAAADIQADSVEIYADGLAAWVLRNQLAPLLHVPEPPP